jgi:hypothetical protein
MRRENEKPCPVVIARHRVGAMRRPMTGSGGQSSIPEADDGIEKLRRTGYSAFAEYDDLQWSSAFCTNQRQRL